MRDKPVFKIPGDFRRFRANMDNFVAAKTSQNHRVKRKTVCRLNYSIKSAYIQRSSTDSNQCFGLLQDQWGGGSNPNPGCKTVYKIIHSCKSRPGSSPRQPNLVRSISGGHSSGSILASFAIPALRAPKTWGWPWALTNPSRTTVSSKQWPGPLRS